MRKTSEPYEAAPSSISEALITRPFAETRIASVDQCRGLCILLMIGGNFAGKFAFMPWWLTHHPHGLSFAELFAPVFFLMVGFSYRLSFLRRMETFGRPAARRSALRRYTLILLLGLVVYMGHFWDALTHIGMAGLLILPVIDKAPRTRMATAILFAAIFQAGYVFGGYDAWVMSWGKSLNGGPLAALSWGILILAGSLVFDVWKSRDARRISRLLLFAAVVLCSLGWILSLEWPGVKEAWPFTRWGMSIPYPIFTAGTACLIYLGFYWCCDVYRLRIPLTAPLGANPLLMYAVMGAFVGISKLVVRITGEPGFYIALASYIGISLTCYSLAAWLYKRGVSIRIS